MTMTVQTRQIVRRIVTRQSGSWKYQRAYGVVQYEQAVTKGGKLVWRHAADVVVKASMPQLRRLGMADLEQGSLHNCPVVEAGE